MELKWKWDDSGQEIYLVTPGINRRHGYIEPVGETSYVNGEHTERTVYNVHILIHLSADLMDCEEVEYVSLRKAMRALKETVTVLLIGRSYGL
jgi:hypothetical protein